jgi:hypothetical protein
MFGIKLADLPRKAKWLVTLVLGSFGLNHLFSAWLVWEVTHNVDAGAKEHFAFKTLAVLLRMAHQHTFGHATMYFITSAIFLLAELSETLVITIVTAAFLGAQMDLASWFLLKYSSERWEILSMIGGLMYSASFLAMTIIILSQMWRKKT